MGGALTYLSDAAVTSVEVEKHKWESKEVEAGSCAMQGWRRSMEDAHFMVYNKDYNVYLFGVFDGHGGSGVSRYCARRIPELVFANEHFKSRNFDVALHEAFMELDLATQQEEVQEELFNLHINSKYTSSEEDRKKIEIHLSFETILDLFLGDPHDQARNPPDPFKAFLDEYILPNPLTIPNPSPGSGSSNDTEEPPRKRKRGYDKRPIPRFTAEPHSPWGVVASRVRQLIVDEKTNPVENSEAQNLMSEMRTMVEKLALEQLPVVPALIRLRREIEWDHLIFKDPLSLLFEGKLASLFHPLENHTWTYSIHPIDLLALLNNEYLAETAPNGLLRRCVSDDQGCTANVCLLDLSGPSPSLYCANAGDSRSIIVRNGKPVPLSIDHKPGLPGERRRIIHAGGKVLGKADPRVQGDLNLSRAIGDWRHKQNSQLPLELQMISPRPDITITNIGKDDEFIVIGCDGIWERFSSADCAKFVDRFFHPKRRPSLSAKPSPDCCSAAESLCVETVRKPYEFPGVPVGVTIGCDNMSVIVVRISQKITSQLETATAPDTLPVISYGAQVPEDWKPPSSARK